MQWEEIDSEINWSDTLRTSIDKFQDIKVDEVASGWITDESENQK